MEDIRDIIKRRQMERKAAQSNTIDPTSDALSQIKALNEKQNRLIKENQNKKDLKGFNGDLGLTSNVNNQDYMNEQMDQAYSEKYAKNQDFNAYEPQEIEGSQDLDWLHENWASKIGKSLINGTGDVVKGWGDALQYASSLGFLNGNEGWSENPLQMIGDLLHEQGAMDTRESLDLSKQNDLIDLISNPDFWLTEAPKMIPQLIDTFAIGHGVGGAASKVGQKAASKLLLKEVAEEGAELAAKNAARYTSRAKGLLGEVKGTTKGVYQGAKHGANEVAGSGSGIMSRVFTDTGKYTKTFGEISNGVAGGAAMNVKLGMQNGAEVYNTYANLTDPKTGEVLFTPQEAGEMARNTLLNQMAYMGADIASFMLVYGKNNALKAGLENSSIEPIKKISKLFSNSQKYLPGRLAKLSGQATLEGVEESFQESWEDWAKLKAFYEKTGSFEHYQGTLPKSMKESGKLGNFMDYYSSDENKTTRNLSGVLGALMGGTFNINEVINKNADQAYNMYNRAENLSRSSIKGTEDDAAKIHHINSTMNEMIMQNKEDLFVPFINHLAEKGVITEEDLSYFQGNFDKLAQKANEVRGIDSLNGKVAFMDNFAEEIAANDQINTLHQKMLDAIDFHQKNVKNPSDLKNAIANEKKNFKDSAELLAKKIILAQNNQQQLLAGKPAFMIDNILDPDMAQESVNPKTKRKDMNQGQIVTANMRNQLRRQANAMVNQMVDGDQATDENSENKSALDTVVDGAKSLYSKATEVAAKVLNTTAEKLQKAKNDAKERKYDEDNLEQVTPEAYEQFKKDGTVSSGILNEIARKKIDNETLTQEEEEIFNKKKDVIDSKVNHATNGITAKQYENADEQSKARVDLARRLKASGNDFDILTDNDFDLLEDEDAFEQSAIELGMIESAVDAIKENQALNPKEVEAVAKYPEVFQEIASENNLANPTESLEKAVVDSDSLSAEEKAYFDRSAKRRAKASKESKIEERRRKLDEFNERRRIKKEEESKSVDEFEAVDTENNLDGNQEEEVKSEDEKIEEAVQEEAQGNATEETKTFLKDNLDKLKEKYPKLYNKLKRESIKEATQKLYEAAKTKSNKIINRGVDINHHLYPPSRLSQVRAVERRLEVMYPNANILVSTIDGMYKTMGIPATALAVNGMIFVDTNTWDNNNKDFFHEVAHIHFNLSRNTPATKSLVKELLKNKELIKFVKENYQDQVLYRINKTFKGRKFPGVDFKTETYQNLVDRIHKELGFKLSDAELKQELDKLVADGIIEEMPMDQQEILIDELFAINMEHQFDLQYKNKFFEEYTDEEKAAMNSDEPKDKRSALRRFIERKTGVDYLRRVGNALKNWIKTIKGQAEDMMKEEDPTASILERYVDGLTDSNQRKLFNKKEKVIQAFLKGSNSKNYTNPSIRYKRLTEAEIEQQNHEKLIGEQIRIQNETQIDRRINSAKTKKVASQDNQEEEQLENNLEEGRNENLFDKDRTLYLNKTSALIKSFSKVYNKSLRSRYLNERKSGDKWEIPTFNGDTLMVDLHDLASSAKSANEFISLIENSEFEEMFEFNDFLDTTRANDKYTYLNSFWMLAKDMKNVDSVQTYINQDGKVDVQSSLSMREKFLDERNFQNVIAAVSAFRKFTGNSMDNYKVSNENLIQFHVSQYDKFAQAVRNIQSDNFTDSDLLAMTSFLGGDKNLLVDNKIVIDGKNRALDSVLVKYALDYDLSQNNIFKPVVGLDNKPVLKNGKVKTEVDPILRKIVRGLVVTDRKNKADFTVLNAEGNQMPSRQIQNALMRKLDEMNQDARSMKVQGFIRKYSRQRGEGLMSNKFLESFYQRANSGQDVKIAQFLGVKNDKDGNYSDFSKNSANDNSINEFLMFLQTGNRTSTYMMDTGRYSDSPVSYLMEVPKLKTQDYFSLKNGKIVFSGEQSKYFVHTVNAYNSFQTKENQLTPIELKKALEKDIADELDFMSSNINAFVDMATMQPFLNEDKTALNLKGEEMVNQYVFNNFMNQTQFNQVMLPDVSGADLGKRAKALRSPGFNFKNTKFETLWFKDDQEEGLSDSMDDSGMYILEEDAQRIQDSFGNLMNLGLGYKLLHAGMEQQNPLFKGKNFYDKGYTTILSEEVVKRNPRLKGLYEAMLKRREQYISKVGKDAYEQSLTSSNQSHLVLAVPMSSVKVKNAAKQTVLPKSFTEDSSKFTLDDYLENGSNNDSHIHQLFNEAYYSGNEFLGLDGSNLIIQNSLDKVRNQINMPVQLSKFITTNGSLNGNLKALEEIQNDIVALQNEQLMDSVDILQNGTLEEIQAHFKDSIDEDFVDTLQMDLLNQGLSLNTPAVRLLAINTFMNRIRQSGNKLKTPGTIAQQKPAKHVKRATDLEGNDIEVFTNISADTIKYANYLEMDKSNLSQSEIDAYESLSERADMSEIDRINKYKGDNLKFYSVNEDGTTRPGEAVVPKYMANKVKTRKYHIFDNSDKTKVSYYAAPEFGYGHPELAQKYAQSLMKYAKEEGRISKKMSVEEYMDNYKVLNKKGFVIGFYVPGDLISATRVPSHGPQSTGIFEVIDFDTTNGSQTQLPSEFALNTTGGDYDGDQVFIQHKQEGNKFNKIFDKIVKQWMSADMRDEITKRIDFEDETKAALTDIENQLGSTKDKSLIGSPKSRRQAFNDTIVSKNNVGSAANYHSFLSMLASYNTSVAKEIVIDGRKVDTFTDYSNAQRSRTIDSAKIFNIILDNAKYQYADRLGINEQTVGDSLILTNLGFDLKTVGLILNSNKYKEYVSKVASKRNMFTPAEANMELDSEADININTADINSKKNDSSIEALISLMSKVKSDMSDLSKIMGGHNRIETDPFILTEQIEKIETLLNNDKQSQVLNISSDIKNNPLVQNYIEVAKTALSVREKFDPVSRKDYKDVFGKITSSSTKMIGENQKKQIHADMERVALSRLLGFNNISQDYKESLTNPNSSNNLFNRISKIITEKKNTILSGKNIHDTVTAYDASLLFSQALSVVTEGNNKFISLRSSYYNENTTEQEKELVRAEFNSLDNQLKKDLMLYDMMVNGWEGRKSLFHIMDDNFKKEISRLSDLDVKNKDSQSISPRVKRDMEIALAEKNQSFYDSVVFNPFPKNKDGRPMLNSIFLKAKDGEVANKIWRKMKNGEAATFFYYDKESKKKFFVQFKGFNGEQISKFREKKISNNDDRFFYLVSDMAKDMFKKGNSNFIIEEIKDAYKGDIGYEKLTSIKDSDVKNNDPLEKTKKLNNPASYNQWLEHTKSGSSNFRFKKDFFLFENQMNRQQFDGAMEYPSFVSEADRRSAYNYYLREKKLADEAYKTINEKTIKDMSTERILNLYNDYANKDQYAYANVLTPLVREVAKRIGDEQTEKYTQIKSDGTDISVVQKYFMSNNIPSNHPMVQGIVRHMENAYKTFSKEQTSYQNKLQDATNALYKEQLGYAIKDGTIIDKIKALIDYLFKNKEEFYTKLYGPLITYDNVQKTDPKGKPYEMKVLRYKDESQIIKEHLEGNISDAQLAFYKATREISNDLVKHQNLKKGERSGFIPHVSPGQMEAFSRRGLLGLMNVSRPIESGLGDVKINFVDPNTGEEIMNASMRDVEFFFSNDIIAKGNKTSNAQQLFKLRTKALKLLKQGINEDGTRIETSDIAAGTVIGENFSDRFSNSGSKQSNNFVTLDLNKAFGDYVHSTLFINGNENFAGMKSMLPMIDGALSLLDKKGQSNMKEYVQSIWKDNFLKGVKKNNTWTPDSLKAIGTSSDKVIDFITRGSLVYWLGYKGLALGGGLYAIGNVLNGKFNNIAHAGGKDWVKGEKRFWLGKSGKFSLKDPLKGVREANQILKEIGFMDINIYDDVSITRKNSLENFFMNIALTPMTYSERWIQGVHFLGMLSDDQWNKILANGKDGLSVEELNMLEDKVKLSHGKGYQATDQRMIQMYSWGRMMLQFSRHIPTVIYNNFGAKDKNIYGQDHVGAYRQVYDVIQQAVVGKMKPADFRKYVNSLEGEEKRKFYAGLMGFGMLASAGALATVGADNKYVNDLASDTNIFFDVDRLGYKLMTPPALGMISKL